MSQEPTPPPPIRQRNTTGHPYNFAETETGPAYTVLPGETTECPVLLDGWTPVDEDEPSADEAAPSEEAEAEPPAPEPKKSSPSRRRAAAADTDKNEGGEPQ